MGFDMPCRIRIRLFTLLLTAVISSVTAADGMAGDPAAIIDARAMVENLGGIAIRAQLKSVHFVHE